MNNFAAAPWTLPSHAAMLTGVLPEATGIPNLTVCYYGTYCYTETVYGDKLFKVALLPEYFGDRYP